MSRHNLTLPEHVGRCVGHPVQHPTARSPQRYQCVVVIPAMQDFHHTVELIELERHQPYPQQWLAPDHVPDTETCDACDLRYNCAAFPTGAQLRHHPL